LTVIGGNILRLQKKVDPASPVHQTYETILKENERLEEMVRDAATYSELYQKEPAIDEVPLESIISAALKGLEEARAHKRVAIAVEPHPNIRTFRGCEDLETMFFYCCRTVSRRQTHRSPISGFLPEGRKRTWIREIEIFNNGKSPNQETWTICSSPSTLQSLAHRVRIAIASLRQRRTWEALS